MHSHRSLSYQELLQVIWLSSTAIHMTTRWLHVTVSHVHTLFLDCRRQLLEEVTYDPWDQYVLDNFISIERCLSICWFAWLERTTTLELIDGITFNPTCGTATVQKLPLKVCNVVCSICSRPSNILRTFLELNHRFSHCCPFGDKIILYGDV